MCVIAITDFLPMSMATKALHDRQKRHEKMHQDPSVPAPNTVDEDEMDLFRRDRKHDQDLDPDLSLNLVLDLQNLIRRKVNKKLKLSTKPKEDKDTGFAPPAPAPEPGSSLRPPTEGAPQLPSPKLLTRTNTRESNASAKSKKSNRSMTSRPIAPAAAAMKTSIAGNSDSEDDSDLDDYAFDHPNTYKDAPWIWVPEVSWDL